MFNVSKFFICARSHVLYQFIENLLNRTFMWCCLVNNVTQIQFVKIFVARRIGLYY